MRTPSPDTARERSRTVWDAMAPGWYARRQQIAEFSRPVSEWMIRKLAPRPGMAVLELAAGVGDTGLMVARLVGDSGRVIVSDFAPAMVAAAKRRASELGATSVEFRVVDAEKLDLPTGSVDGVLCRWGYMLMIDPTAAFAETRRVLRPGGRLVFSVFAAPDRNPWASLVGRILVEEGLLAPPDPSAPGIFALANPGRMRELLAGAGFAEPEIEPLELRWRFEDRRSYWQFLVDAAGALSPIIQGLPPEGRRVLEDRLHERASPFHAGAGYDFPAVALNVVAS